MLRFGGGEIDKEIIGSNKPDDLNESEKLKQELATTIKEEKEEEEEKGDETIEKKDP
jgi:hypothetical protein